MKIIVLANSVGETIDNLKKYSHFISEDGEYITIEDNSIMECFQLVSLISTMTLHNFDMEKGSLEELIKKLHVLNNKIEHKIIEEEQQND